MERLTEKTKDGIVVKEDYGENVLKTLYPCYGQRPTEHYSNCTEGYCAVEKLMEYEDMEEDGTLIQLPCRIGQTVYEIQELRKKIQSFKIIGIHIGLNNDIFFEWKLATENGSYQNLKGFKLSELGKNIFLTREEAEKILKKIEI